MLDPELPLREMLAGSCGGKAKGWVGKTSQVLQPCHRLEKLHEETVLSKSLCRLLNKASHLTAFYTLYSSLHLPVTPAQLMRPGIGRNASCAVGDFA